MKPLVRNSIFMGLFNIFGRSSGFIRYLLLVGFLSDEHFSQITFALNIGLIGRHFMDGGLDNLVSRDGARDYGKVPTFYIHALAIKMVMGTIFFCGAFVYLYWIRHISWMEIAIVYVALCGSSMLSLTGVIRSCFTAIERMEYFFYTNMPARTISILLLFLALWYSMPLVFAAAAISMENLIWFFILGSVSLRFFKLTHVNFSFSTIRYMIAESWPLALYCFFNILYLRLDVMMIEYLMDDIYAVGPYTYSSLLLEGVTMLFSGYFIAIYPALSRLYTTDFDAYRRLFRQSVIIVMAFSMPLSIVLSFWAHDWMNFIKETGEVSGQVLRILAINLNLSMLNTLAIIVFTSCNRQRWLVLFTGIAVVTSFLSNLWLIPILQQPGAALASLLSQIFLFIIMVTVSRIFFDLRFPVRKPLEILSISLLSGAGVWIIPGLPLLVKPFVFVGFLGLSAYVFSVITVNEVQRYWKVLRK